MNNRLNGGPVRERRIAAGWSVPELARRVGVQPEVIWAIERGELPALRQLPLAALADLAELLDISLSRLFDETGAQLDVPDADAAMVGAVLLRYRDGLALEVLTGGLAWSAERVAAALEHLGDSLEPCGARLTRAGAQYAIQARRGALPIQQWRGIAQVATPSGGPDGPLSTEAAVLLHGLLYANCRIASESCDGSNAALLGLLGQELVEDLGDRFGVVAEVGYSQGLIEAECLPCDH